MQVECVGLILLSHFYPLSVCNVCTKIGTHQTTENSFSQSVWFFLWFTKSSKQMLTVKLSKISVYPKCGPVVAYSGSLMLDLVQGPHCMAQNFHLFLLKKGD